jgi:hypothetical protein
MYVRFMYVYPLSYIYNTSFGLAQIKYEWCNWCEFWKSIYLLTLYPILLLCSNKTTLLLLVVLLY